MRNRLGWLLVALLPAAAGLGMRLLLAFGRLPNPVVFLRADLGTTALLVGLLLSVLWGIALLFVHRKSLAHSRELGRLQTESQSDRRRFLQRLDHELKNPLTAIQAGLVNLEAQANPGEGAGLAAEALDSVKAQTMRLSRLVSDLRKIAELETREIERSPVDLNEVLREALDLACEGLLEDERQISLSLPQAPWPLPNVQGDRDLLFLAIYNLVTNALKFTGPGDTVEVRAFEDGHSVVVEIADTGMGIPEEERPHVWQELYRGAAARGVPGSGLGLALVRAIAERHEGQVSLRSRARQGTVVALRLPGSDVSNL